MKHYHAKLVIAAAALLGALGEKIAVEWQLPWAALGAILGVVFLQELVGELGVTARRSR